MEKSLIWRYKAKFAQQEVNGVALLTITQHKTLLETFGINSIKHRSIIMQALSEQRNRNAGAEITRDQSFRHFCYLLFASMAVFFILFQIQNLLIPMVVAAFLTMFLAPVVDLLRQAILLHDLCCEFLK